MTLPRFAQLACAANILAALCLLASNPELADLHTETSATLLQDGADMPDEVLDVIAATIREGLRDFAPTLRNLADRLERAPTPAPKQRPQDTEFDALLAQINVRGTKGNAS